MRLSTESSGVDQMDASVVGRRLALADAVAGVAGLVVPASAAAASTGAFTVTASPLNVRSGPGTSYAKVGRLAFGTRISATTSGTWRKITAGTYTGRWVHGSYLRAVTVTSSTFSPLKYVYSIPVLAGGVTLRAGWNGKVYTFVDALLEDDFNGEASHDCGLPEETVTHPAASVGGASGVAGSTGWNGGLIGVASGLILLAGMGVLVAHTRKTVDQA